MSKSLKYGCLQTEIDPNSRKIVKELPIVAHAFGAQRCTLAHDSFGSAVSFVAARKKHGKTFFSGEIRYTKGCATSTDGDRHVFKLPTAHPGTEQFKDAVGSILNAAGFLFALITGGEHWHKRNLRRLP